MWLLKDFNPLTDKPILGSSNSAGNKDVMSEIWANGNTIILLSRKHCAGEIAHYQQFLLFPHCFQKLSVVDASKQVSME